MKLVYLQFSLLLNLFKLLGSSDWKKINSHVEFTENTPIKNRINANNLNICFLRLSIVFIIKIPPFIQWEYNIFSNNKSVIEQNTFKLYKMQQIVI